MTKRQRSLLFAVLVVLVLAAAPSLVLYSQGYRVDFQTLRITQTGGLYFKVHPSRASVFINEKLVKRTDFLLNSALIPDRFPGKYLVEIAKEGYQSWRKILEVKERGVTEAKNVVLFPEHVAFQTVTDKVERFWVAPNRQRALLQKQTPEKSWRLSLLNLQTQGETPLLAQQNSKEEVLDVVFAPNSKRVLITKNTADELQYLVQGIETEPCFEEPCSLDFLSLGAETLRFSPLEEDVLLYTQFRNTSKVLFARNYATGEIISILGSDVVTFTVHGNSVIWLDEAGLLWQKNLQDNLPAQAIESPVFEVARERPHELFMFGNAMFLQQAQTLFQLAAGEEEPLKMLSPVESVQVSPDGKKLALANASELWLLYLQNVYGQPPRTAGEKVFLTRLSDPISNLQWLDAHYLVFAARDTIRTLEVDTRDRLNGAVLGEFPSPRLFWHPEQGVLYVHSNTTLSVSERLGR